MLPYIKFITLTILGLHSTVTFAQSLISQVSSSGGEQITTPTLSLSYTIGESVVTSTNSPFVNNCGFHQGSQTPVSVDDLTAIHTEFVFRAYPNPFRDAISIDLDSRLFNSSPLSVELYDSQMKRIIQQSFLADDKVELNTKGISPGVYFLFYRKADELSAPIRVMALPF